MVLKSKKEPEKLTIPRKCITLGANWAQVLHELQGEDLKQKIYDNTLFEILGDLQGKRILDYGAGPGIIANRAKKEGAHASVFDISEGMRLNAAEKIGVENVFDTAREIPSDNFDIVLCNLVLCIIDKEAEVAQISKNIRYALHKDGIAYVGFCNPRIFDVPESIIDFRLQTGRPYAENHQYEKIKKEGNYKIVEMHRPIEWYNRIFIEAGLRIAQMHLTPEYELKGNIINDFVIFQLSPE